MHDVLVLAAASLRGADVDRALTVFLTACVAALVVVHAVGLWVWLREPGDARPGRVGVVWAGAAAVGLVALLAFSERTWRDLRAGLLSDAAAGDVQRVLVVGERFAWSVVYPGPDGTLGRHLVWPSPDDALWPNPDIVDAETAQNPPPFTFAGVRGPADLPPDARERQIARYRDGVNPLGVDYADPAGWDDDRTAARGRPIIVDVGRPVEVTLGSKDVIHDFFVPALRVKRDVVPGVGATLRFTPTRAGTYRVLCAEFCGWGHTTMTGELVVREVAP